MNESLATLFERLAGRRRSQWLLRRMGLDPKQFVLFLGLLRTLSERNEFMGGIGVSRFSISYLSLYAFAAGLVPWACIASVLPAKVFLTVDLLLTFVLIFLLMIREAANSLFNPVEASMLSDKPVHGRTYAAAKIGHIVVAVLYLVPGLAAWPALMGLQINRVHWYWPVTHLASAFLVGLWTALMICGLYGWIRGIVPAQLLKGIATWIQLISLLAFISIPIFFTSFFVKMLTVQFEGTPWTWLPLTWFAEFGFLGQQGATWRLGWEGGISVLASILIIWFGLRNFSDRYFSEGSFMLEGSGWRNRRKSKLSCSGVVRLLTGSPAGLASFCLVSKMIRRDWQFRRAILTQAWVPFLVIIAIVLTVARTGVLPAPIGNESAAHLFPHLLGLITMAVCVNISATEFHQGSWIYLTAPIGNLRPFVRGIYWALWIPAAAIPHLVLLPFLAGYWGWREALFYAAFNLIVVSLYIGFELSLIPGMPFSSPVNESRTMVNMVYIQTCWVMVLVFPALLQLGLFQLWGLAASAGVVIAVGTVFVVHWKIGDLEGNLRWQLYKMKAGPNCLFRDFGS